MKNQNRKTEYEAILRRSEALLRYASQVEETDDIIGQTAVYALAPALQGFVIYALDDALRRGVKRLYFLARDAYFMYRTAAAYVKQYNLPLECKYLYVSRHSIRVPLYHKDQQQALDYIVLGGLDVTPEKVLNRADFGGEPRRIILKDVENRFGIGPQEQIPRNRLPELRKYLEEKDIFRIALEQHSKECYPNLVQYLAQEGFYTEDPIVIVDSGWVGSMQKNLVYLRQEEGIQRELHGYYFGLYELPKGVEEGRYHSYFFGPRDGLRRKVLLSNCLFEGVFTAPHGMTLGYEEKRGKMYPIRKDISEEKWAYIERLETVFDAYQTQVLKDHGSWESLKKTWLTKRVDRIVEKSLKRLMTNPSYEEAQTFGTMEFTDDVLEYPGQEMAAVMSEEDLRDNHVSHRIWQEIQTRRTGQKPVIKQSAWYEGSAALYSQGRAAMHHCRSYQMYKYLMQYRKRRIWQKQFKA